MKNFVVKGAQKGAEKVLMANVLACSGAIAVIERIKVANIIGASKCRASRKEISLEEAMNELEAQHDAVCAKAKSSADRIKAMLSKKSVGSNVEPKTV